MSVALLVVITALLFPSPAMGQNSVPELDVVALSTDRDQVTVTVVAPPELRISDVTLGSFVVQIGDDELLPTIEQIAGDNLDVVLLVDTSGSMAFEALDAAKTSGAAFVRQLPESTRISIVSFGDEATVAQPFTPNHTDVITTLNGLEAGGETALHAAVVTAAQQFDPRSDSVRAIVLLSDGGNTVAQSSLGSAQAALRSSGATLHAISINTDEANVAELESLAEASNGTVGQVEQLAALELLQRAIAVDLGNQYRLRFTADGEGSQTARLQARIGAQVVAETTLTVSLPLAPAVVANPTPVADAFRPDVAAAEPVAPPSASPPVISQDAVGNNLALKWLSIAAVAVALAAICLTLMIPAQRTPKRVKPVKPFEKPPKASTGRGLRWLASRLADILEGRVGRRPFGLRLAKKLDASGWKVRTSEFVVLAMLAAGAGFLVGALRSLRFGIIAAAVAIAFVMLVLNLKVKRRRSAFSGQMVAALQMLSGALRTGYSLPQSINLVAKEAEAPVNEEFARVAIEMRLGRDLVEALEGVSVRMANDDFLWTIGAIDIARDVGGDLAGVLDNVGETMRTRERIKRQIYALSAEGRISAYILILLPFPMFFWQLLVNREYTGLLVTDPVGQIIFGSGISLLIFGSLWLRRLIRVDY